ncbi:helix-turn-helix transcriptional regulator [Arcticibacter tournemirensis]|uniref:YafY family transcriptional regulator n=1 Tax=Arcticibacter tournemirensis TaxID=699437 RepID=A0A4Q0MGC5_9SPHI|nr:YafY family protein [Arcticibacter tournemirensis]RXF72520.1 YafY family transcriptional regulator [Arcticibacter tournemirensis]
MNRIDRLSAILIQLQSRRVVKAIDIAERFNISLRTVYRDVKALEEAGIPIIGEAGVGYSLMEGYRLPPIMFTREEATALLTAEKLVEKLTDASNGAIYKSAMYKIKAVLRKPEKDLLENLDSYIEVLQTRPQKQASQPGLNILQTILKAINDKRVVDICYFAHYKQESTHRQIEPIGVFYLDNYWHLVAFCHMREDYRDFRMDRIRSLSLTNEPYQHQHISLKEYTEQEYKCRDLLSVVIRVNKKAARHLAEQKYYNGFISETEKDDSIEMSFLTAFPEGFARWFLMFADEAVLVEPVSLKNRIEEILSAISAKLQSPQLT